ncbi:MULTISPECIES: 2-phosphosulfolactate phosphatase [Amycolatopsis]|uniref:Probable 2-phosphosulfolactate phosphatase n=1 Tax=Amycolatopsis dendrobii TaxID=2760662 RepID=A0A7W3W1I3_9PSEU|nr:MULTISPECIES: 2-phosphosulfolactate phosphatase [Amycolatopsis]MBB1157134.1 2-phosphosulfolactate phosphatase [Amycolatopsis dendrobii]UKD59473.1 2-phosphosulfolactate phosphatase [Amycolatopsis sp. FU40]
MDIAAQRGTDVRLEWGGEGVAVLGRECAVLIIVDVLSFSTTTDLVVSRGGRVLPVRWRDERGVAEARGAGAVVAGEEEWTLRPSSVTEIPSGTLLALPSPNGATLCAAAAKTGAHVLAGCLRNASATAAKAREIAGGRPIGVIPAGERWGVDLFGEGAESGPLRPCVEDQLGAGAIVSALPGSWSAEAALAAAAYAGTDVPAALRACSSGRELAATGHGNDVVLAAQQDVSASVASLAHGILEGR